MRAALAAALLLLAALPAAAADRCLSRSEARKLWPHTHLYWSSVGGQRCWSNRRGKRGQAQASAEAAAARRRAVAALVPTSAPPPPALPLPFILPPAEIATAPVMPTLRALDGVRWEWLAEARASLHDEEAQPLAAGTVVYSTFAGRLEPDTWPSAQESVLLGVVLAVGGAELAIIVAWIVWRLWRDRLRA